MGLTPERRREIERLFEAALERVPEERAPFLDAACGEDLGLRREVEALLSAHARSHGILERDPVAALGEPEHVLAPGETVGAYTVEREIGRGGTAVVYLARDPGADRRVAVKLLHPGLTALLGRERFRREIRLASRLSHPGILALLDSGEEETGLWYAMPYVEGETLRGRLRREERLAVEDAVRVIREVAAALGYAHQRGVIHRDIKPENLLLDGEGRVLVADFGIGRVFDSPVIEETLTRTGMLIGTPAYMSPEQALGHRNLDGRTDIYSLGCVLYEMLAGTPPFPAETPQLAIARHVRDPVPSLRETRPDVPSRLEAAVCRALAKTPAERFTSAAALAEALEPGEQPWWQIWRR